MPDLGIQPQIKNSYGFNMSNAIDLIPFLTALERFGVEDRPNNGRSTCCYFHSSTCNTFLVFSRTCVHSTTSNPFLVLTCVHSTTCNTSLVFSRTSVHSTTCNINLKEHQSKHNWYLIPVYNQCLLDVHLPIFTNLRRGFLHLARSNLHIFPYVFPSLPQRGEYSSVHGLSQSIARKIV